MDFDSCFALLAARPAHAHHCEPPAEDAEPEDTQKARQDASAAFAQLRALALAAAFFRLQEERAVVYKSFHAGFEEHQQSPRFAEFAAGVTARFAALSNQINSVESALIEKQQPVLAQCIRKIQLEEREKLLVTSALLVEKMRLRDAQKRPEPDAVTSALLERSVETLADTHTAIVQRINELLDELRSEAMDLDGDDDGDA